MSLYGVGTVVTSQATPLVNPVSDSLFGRPFIIRRTEGWIAHTQLTVTDSAGPHLVSLTGHTLARPSA